MAILLGLLVALTYGSGDFFGGLAAKRSPASAVVVGSFGLSALLLFVATAGWALVGHLPVPDAADLWLGVAVGAIGPVSLGLLYRGLAGGRMSVVAPITAVVGAIVPFAWALLDGERPSSPAVGGVVVAVLAVGLISAAPEHGSAEVLDPGASAPSSGGRADLRSVVLPALASGFGFGVIFVLLGSTSSRAGLWPLVVARPVAVVLAVAGLGAVARGRGSGLRPAAWPAAGSWGLVAATGVLDVGANVIYLAASREGLLSIVAVLSSLYPASTVVLARLVLRERLHRVQVAGLVLATVGVVAMTVG